MKVARRTQGSVEIVAVSGRFDFAAHRDFRQAFNEALASAHGREVRIDLAGADYMDSSALGMLLLSLENAKEAGKTLSLSGARGAVKQVLDIANFQRLFTIL